MENSNVLIYKCGTFTQWSTIRDIKRDKLHLCVSKSQKYIEWKNSKLQNDTCSLMPFIEIKCTYTQKIPYIYIYAGKIHAKLKAVFEWKGRNSDLKW